MKSFCVSTGSIEIKRGHFSKFPGKTHYLGLLCRKLKAAHPACPVNYFPRFLGKNIKNCPTCKLFLFTSLAAEGVVDTAEMFPVNKILEVVLKFNEID